MFFEIWKKRKIRILQHCLKSWKSFCVKDFHWPVGGWLWERLPVCGSPKRWTVIGVRFFDEDLVSVTRHNNIDIQNNIAVYTYLTQMLSLSLSLQNFLHIDWQIYQAYAEAGYKSMKLKLELNESQ